MLMTITDWLWSYVLIGALLIVGIRFTIGSRYVQIRLFRRTWRCCRISNGGAQSGVFPAFRPWR